MQGRSASDRAGTSTARRKRPLPRQTALADSTGNASQRLSMAREGTGKTLRSQNATREAQRSAHYLPSVSYAPA
eukprot:scaffold803_cov310-Pinguiococcus_pyrenoidosus.AAC.215